MSTKCVNKKQTEEIRRSFSSRSHFLYRCRSVILSLPAEGRNKRRRGDTKLETDQYRNFSILIFRFFSSPLVTQMKLASGKAKRKAKAKGTGKIDGIDFSVACDVLIARFIHLSVWLPLCWIHNCRYFSTCICLLVAAKALSISPSHA